MDDGMPWYVAILVAAMIVSMLGMLSAARETRAVRELRRWPFRAGIVATRFLADLPGPVVSHEESLRTPSAEARVL